MQKILIEDNLHMQAKAAAALLGWSLRRYAENAIRVMTDADLGDPDGARQSIGRRRPPRIRKPAR